MAEQQQFFAILIMVVSLLGTALSSFVYLKACGMRGRQPLKSRSAVWVCVQIAGSFPRMTLSS